MSSATSSLSGVKRAVHERGARVVSGYSIFVLLLMWLPMVTLVVLSVSAEGLLTFPPTEVTMDWYLEIFTSRSATSAILTTLKVGVVATPLTIAVATLTVIGIDRYEFRAKPLVVLLIISPLMIPGIVGALSVFQVAQALRLQGYWVVVLVHVIRTLPFAMLVMLETFSNFDESLEAAAMDLGANEVETFRTVTVPNIATGVVAATLLTFTVSFNEFIFTYFVRDSGTMTLPVYLWNKIVYGLDPSVNAISVIFLFVAGSFIGLAVVVSSVRNVATS
jgi:spermidine/putrescine transport system permease protein